MCCYCVACVSVGVFCVCVCWCVLCVGDTVQSVLFCMKL